MYKFKSKDVDPSDPERNSSFRHTHVGFERGFVHHQGSHLGKCTILATDVEFLPWFYLFFSASEGLKASKGSSSRKAQTPGLKLLVSSTGG